MTPKKTALTLARDPFTLLRQMTAELDQMLQAPSWTSFPTAPFGTRAGAQAVTWLPEVDVFERGNQLITKIDLPGLKKEDVKVEVTDGQLAISGERKTDAEEKKDDFYRCERAYGSFYRVVPLPEGVKPQEVKATFADGVLEVSLPLPTKAEAKAHKVEIQDAPKAAPAAV